jgi:hypothetical protein
MGGVPGMVLIRDPGRPGVVTHAERPDGSDRKGQDEVLRCPGDICRRGDDIGEAMAFDRSLVLSVVDTAHLVHISSGLAYS